MTAQSAIAPVTVAPDLRVQDLRAALAAGWRDFAACPAYGLFFAAFYVLGGLGLFYGLSNIGQGWWLIPIMAGFPLLAPFTAVGLYEVSRRREAGLPIGWGGVLGALGGRGDGQIILMGGIVFVAFSFWMILAHGIFAIFLGESGVGAEIGAMRLSADAIMMLLVGGTGRVDADIGDVAHVRRIIRRPAGAGPCDMASLSARGEQERRGLNAGCLR